MEILKTSFTAILILASLILTAQPITESKKGCVRAQGNLAGGYLPAQQQASAYLAADLDVFVDDKLSITGEGWYGFNLNRQQTGLQKNHALHWGFNYHPIRKGKLDPYFGLSPGLGIAEIGRQSEDRRTQRATGYAALLSGAIGMNYYIGSVFHLFLKVRATAGQVRAAPSEPFIPLHEVKLTAGLGWNMRLWSPQER
ncbi:MAG: hypothetical protein KatS3mg031_0124 [Chitinophagales bacterium]|nr:MAG: hypothetical protein KatS3mg031_0124 [Chitinophagales bacterium]